MLKYIVRRLLEVIPTTFGIILLTFILFNVVGGSPAQVILGKNATAESIAAFNHKYGYDLPMHRQFVKFCTDLAHGDFGISTEADEPVLDVLKRGVGPSLSLTVPILFGGTAVGLMLAMLCAATRGGAFDKAVLVASTVLMSVNYVVWVLAGQFILAFKLHLFPVWGYENAFYLALPVLIGMILARLLTDSLGQGKELMSAFGLSALPSLSPLTYLLAALVVLGLIALACAVYLRSLGRKSPLALLQEKYG